jgi:hypothetical protein
MTHLPKGILSLALALAGLVIGANILSPAPRTHELRSPQLTVSPGGIVPWHSHDDRPALIYFAEGEIMEYASNCSLPIVHKAVRATSRPVGIRPMGCPP